METKQITNNAPPISSINNDFIFVSYSHANKDTVYEDLWELYNSGVPIRYDDHLKSGKAWTESVENDIKNENCKLVVFFLSKDAIISEAVQTEVGIVEKLNKNYIYVKMFEEQIDHVYIQCMYDNTLSLNECTLLRKFFNDSIVYVDYNLSNHVDELLSHLIKYNIKISAKVVNEHRDFRKILILAKNSSFSKSIINGINDVLIKADRVSVKTVLIDKNLDKAVASLQFNETLKQSIPDYDCFILRPPEKYLSETLNILKEISLQGKNVILADINLKADQLNQFKVKPSFVGSDFSAGGRILAKRVLEIIQRLQSINYKIVFAQGPFSYDTAVIRCMSFINNLKPSVQDNNIIKIILDTFNAASNCDKFEQLADDWAKNNAFDNADVFVYCGNDNLAAKIMQTLNSFKPSNLKSAFSKCRNIIFIGYDGLKDINNDWMLLKYGYNFITADVVPFKQGVAIGNKALDLLFKNSPPSDCLEQPALIENLDLPIRKTSKIKDVLPLFSDKKVVIFDLDGTIADTESLHWLAYNRLLQTYGVQLDDEHINSYIGHAETKIYRRIKSDYNIEFDDAQFLLQRIEIYKKLVEETNLQPFKFIVELLPAIKDKILLLVTSQLPSVVDYLLRKWQLTNYFKQQYIFCCHDGKYSKAEIYKNVSDYAGARVLNSEVVLLEDSDHYLKAGILNHFTTIGIEHKFNKDKLKSCNIVLSDEYIKGLFVGLCGIDIVYYHAGKIPENNNKLKITNYDCAIGGPAANAAITYSLLGGKAYLICAIGNSFLGEMIKKVLQSFNIDVIDIGGNSFGSPNISSVHINKLNGDRTILSGQNQTKIAAGGLAEDILSECDFALYDGNLPCIESELIDQIQSLNKPLIIDAGSHKPGLKQMFDITTDIITSQNFCDENGNDIFILNNFYDFKFVAKTRGNLSVLYSENNTKIKEIDVPQVKACDTLGAGDVLHGAYCFYKFVKAEDSVLALRHAIDVASYATEKSGVVNGVRYAIQQLENRLKT